ncbi:unnamed protein product [Kluyveromyces dobzhanskii CBS 2104]|uniref:WGS project CCBQ000000000 data, contig 00058 n=1 Tax=Kluyveromyces dobzhanskii CBS 2104 TaxID=1427455 RepID=A0A0A8LBW6_9SACH|nr:unnamed protein product [Kluyveromyces dobzhanskii CBS 2104]
MESDKREDAVEVVPEMVPEMAPKEQPMAKKYGQTSITDFKSFKVQPSEVNEMENSHFNEPISRRRSNRVVVKRKADSDEEAEHSRKKRPYNRKVLAKTKKGKKSDTQSASAKTKPKKTDSDKESTEKAKDAPRKSTPAANGDKKSGTPSKKTVIKKKSDSTPNGKNKEDVTAVTVARKKTLDFFSNALPISEKNTSKDKLKTEPSLKAPPKDAIKISKPVSKPVPSLSLAVNPILLENWAPQLPVLSADFKTQTSVLSRLKFPHMKKVTYGKDLVLILSFINKFHRFLPQDLWSLSIQDLEIGLDVYPENIDDDQELSQYYADYVPAKEIRRCQDYANLLYVVLMELTLNRKSNSTLQSLQTSSKPYKLISELRQKGVEFGYPREWKVQSTLNAESVKVYEHDDTEPVDPSHPEILTPNAFKWTEQLVVPLEEDPLHSPDLERLGLLALMPSDRIVFLRTLTQWCIAYSEKIHTEVYRLSHLKKDPSFGIQTHHAPRHLVQGIDATHQHFKKLCTLVKERMELRRSKKHVKKQLESGTRQDLSAKFALLDDLKKNMREYRQEYNQTAVDKKKKFDALAVSVERDYEKWSKLVFEEIHDREPLDNPYEDEIYKLRCLEFFIGRVPYVGDFYLPRLFTYQSSKAKKHIPTNYCDPITLLQTLQEFENGTITPFELFSRDGKLNSMQFKLYYHDTPGLVHDLMNGSNAGKNYWYEMCHDSSSLQDFIRLLEYKVYKEEDLNKSKKSADESGELEKETTDFLTADTDKETSKKNVPTGISKEDTTSTKLETIEGFNCNPLPKEYKYNKSRSKFLILKEYLQKMSSLLHTFEQLKVEYGDVSSTDRNLRRSQRSKVSYAEAIQESSDEENEPATALDDEEEQLQEEIENKSEVFSEREDLGKDYEEHSDNDEEVEEEYQLDSEDDDDLPKKRGRPPKKNGKASTHKKRSSK